MRKIKNNNIERTISWLLIVCINVVLLYGCIPSESQVTTENTKMSIYETENNVSTEEHSESEEKTSKGEEPVSYITGSKTLEALVPALWGRMLEYCGHSNVWLNDYTAETWEQMHKDFELLQYDADYSVEAYLIKIASARPGRTEIDVFYERFGATYKWEWRERDESGNLLKITPELYPEAEKYWWIAYSYDDMEHYSAGREITLKRLAMSPLKVSGMVRKVFHEKGKQQWDNVVVPFGMWSSVIKELGKLYLEETGTVLGELKAEAYLMEFDFETIEGRFWICPDGAEPIAAYFDYEGGECSQYTCRFDETAVWNESEKENAWASLELDLVTEKLK